MLIERLTRTYLRSGLRGSVRFAQFASRHFMALQRLPIITRGYPPVIIDLRLPGMATFFQNSPYENPPWEVEQQILMRRLVRPGDVVYDIGANVGFHTVFLSVLVGPTGRVHSFEANSELYDTLRLTVAALPNATLHEFGVSERDEHRSLVIPVNREMASLGAWTHEPHAATRPCALRSLASVLEEGLAGRPQLIKCDIEGAELMMLRGAVPLLDSPDAPIVLAEANSGAARSLGYVSSEIPQFLSNLARARYSIFVEESPSRWVRTTRFVELNQYVLAVPEARLDRWPGLETSNTIVIRDGKAVLS